MCGVMAGTWYLLELNAVAGRIGTILSWMPPPQCAYKARWKPN